jgi:hypothetical protein
MKKIIFFFSLSISFGSFAQTSGAEVLSFYNGCTNPATDSGGVVIKTKLPFGAPRYMPTIVIEGNNFGTAQSVGLMVNFYVYNDGPGEYFNSPKVSSHGGYAPDVYLFNDAGFVSIFLKRGVSQYCLSFKVRAWLRTPTDGGATSSWFTDWSAANVNTPPAATSNFTKLSYENTMGRVTSTADAMLNGLKIGLPKGTGNLGIGIDAVNSLTTGISNTAIGANALNSTKSGNSNVALGWVSMVRNVKGNANVGIGSHTLQLNVAKSFNVAVGFFSQRNANSDSTVVENTFNTSVGANSLTGSTTSANNTGKFNTALGGWALTLNTSGNEQSALGYNALYNSTGHFNSALGGNAGFELTTGTSNTFIGQNTGRGITTGSGNTIIGASLTGLSAALTNTIIMAAGGTERMRIDQNGNMGIGTTTPGARLEVTNTSNSFIKIKTDGDLNTIYNGLEFSHKRPSSSVYSTHKIYSNVNDLIFEADEAMQFKNNDILGLYLNNAGNVAIGTATVPIGYKLAVDGNLIAEKIVVKNSTAWPDFVFKKDYKLPPLSEVEQFISKNSHLPEIPSAKEVENNGQDVGEMNKLLLKKVEELTLYMIEMKKENDALKKRVDKLEKQ